MTLTTAELTHALLALVALLVVAHLGGHLFRLIRQPQVIGEIAGGLVLGPSVLGVLAPHAQRWLLPHSGQAADVLGFFYEFGLLLLVQRTGAELRRRSGVAERRTIGMIAAVGLVLPFLCGLGMARLTDLGAVAGTNGSPTALTLVFGMAIAVTSVPVISRIMMDLGILTTLFARVVLAVAVIEDIFLYVILAMVLGVAGAQASDTYGLPSLLEGDSAVLSAAYFVLVPLGFLAVLLRWGPAAFRRLSRSRWNTVAVRSPLASRLVLLLLLSAACAGLGIDPIFGALVAGLCGANPGQGDAGTHRDEESGDALHSFSSGVFVPVYFALVGVKLDLAHHFDVLFFCWFLALACVAKLFSVWLGARLAGEPNSSALYLAVAMNARGGPGIVLASVALGAHVINESFFTTLVLLSVLTSQFAGFLLGRAMTRGTLSGPSGERVGRRPGADDTEATSGDHSYDDHVLGAKNDSAE